MCSFGPFEVDFARSRLLKSGIPVHVQDQPLLILQVLLENPGEIVTREQLRERLWASQTFVDFERSLNAAVAKLRQVLSDSAERPLYIETVARKGYRFIAPVTRPLTETTAPEREPTLTPTGQVDSPKRKPYTVPLAAVGVLILFCGAVVWLGSTRRSEMDDELGPIRFSLVLPEGSRIAEPSFAPPTAISPDGKNLALVTSEPGRTSISWRPLASETLTVVDGTEGARLPFWSPDSEEIGFFADGKLKVSRLPGGPVRTICGAPPTFFGATWNRNDVVLFSDGTTLLRVAASGGLPRQVLKLDGALTEVRQTWPQFLPDQVHFIFFEENIDSSKSGVFLAALDGSQPRMIFANRTRGVFALPNDVLFVRDGTLFAQELNRGHTRLQGRSTALADHVDTISAFGQAAFSVSATGMVIYRTSENEAAQLVLYSRDGKRIRSFGPVGPYTQVAISPDEKVAALNVRTPSDRIEAARIWLLRLDGEIVSRLDFGGIANTDPVWSPDSRRIAFASFEAQGQKTKIFQWAMGDPSPTLLLTDGNSNKPDDWSPNGFLLCRRNNQLAFSLAIQEHAVPRDLGDKPFPKDGLRLSPDGKMIAYNTWTAHYYTSGSDHPDVFVATFPEFGKTTQVSVDGGVQPFWGPGGRELYYLAIDGSVMSVRIGDRRTVEPKTPKVLFRSSLQASQWRSQYSASVDGQRFYVLEPVRPQRDILHVITRWNAEKSQ